MAQDYIKTLLDTFLLFVFYYNLSIIFPILCFIPVSIIYSKTKKKTVNLFYCLGCFYKILFIENPVKITIGCIYVIFTLALVSLYIEKNDKDDKDALGIRTSTHFSQ